MVRVTLVAGAMAIAGAACGNAQARTCGTSGGAEFCLVEEGPSFRQTGRGFQPDSEVHVVVDDNPARSPTARADENGNFPPPELKAWVNRGETTQRVRVTGTTAAGAEARIELTVPPRQG